MQKSLNQPYDELAAFYDDIMGNRKHFRDQEQLILKICKEYGLTKKSRFLDAACGTGIVVRMLYKKGYTNINGTDGSEKMIKSSKLNSFGDLFFVYKWIDLHNYFIKHKKYDLIYILGNSLPHVYKKDLDEIFENIYEGLKNGGLFTFDIRNWVNINGNLKQPNRPEGIRRCLGEIGKSKKKISVYDQVEYKNGVQNVTYYIYKVSEKKLKPDYTVTLRYRVYEENYVTNKLIKAGFKKEKIKILRFLEKPPWPYSLIISVK